MPPTSLIDSLHAVRRKVRLLAIASGMGVATVAAVALLAALVVVDWTLVLDKFPRMLFMTGAVGMLGYVIWRWLLKPAVARLNIGDVAGRLEHTFPQFDDRLRSTVNFVQGEIPGSAAMQNRVAAEASAMASHVDLSRVILHRPVYLSVFGGLLAALLLAGVAILFGVFFAMRTGSALPPTGFCSAMPNGPSRSKSPSTASPQPCSPSASRSASKPISPRATERAAPSTSSIATMKASGNRTR